MLMTLADDMTGTLAFWVYVEMALRQERDDAPVTGAEYKAMRINAAKAWIEAGSRDYSQRKKHDIRNPHNRKGRFQV